MSKGLKRICMNCSMRFYDLDKNPIICPSCDTEFTGEIKVKARRGRIAPIEEKAPVKEVKAVVAEDDEDDIDDIDADDDIVSLDDVEEDDIDEDDDVALPIEDDDLEDDLDDIDDEEDDIEEEVEDEEDDK